MKRSERLVLTVSVLASFVAFLDGAIVNVALPAIQNDLGGGLSVQQWVVDAYLLTLGSFILIAGSLSDLLGRRKILSLGLLGFAITSVLCAMAPNAGFLIIARALQGIAGALLVPSSLALIMSSFSGPAQGRAVGSWTAWTGIAFIIGPLFGGFLIDAASWRWIFGINVLPIVITLYLLDKIPAPNDEDAPASIDIIGASLCALGLGASVFALIEQPHYGWGDPLIYLSLVIGVVLLTVFLTYESRIKHPMLPLGLFRNRNFSVGNVATLFIYAGLGAGTFLIAVFLQQVAGYSALQAGMSLLPVTVIMFFLSSRWGALSGRFGPRIFMTAGPLIAGLGFLLMLNVGADLNYWRDLLPGVVVFGLGLSITVAPLTSAILGDVSPSQSGIASAINNAIARIAGLIAVAAVGAVVAAQFTTALADQLLATTPIHEIEKLQQTPLQIKSSMPPDINPTAVKKGLVGASESAFQAGVGTIAGLLIVGGVVSGLGINNQQRDKK